MGRFVRSLPLLVSLVLLWTAAAPAADKKPPAKREKTVLEKRIDLAVKRAVTWLRKHQNGPGRGREGAWSFREPYWESGVTSLAIFSMLKAGVKLSDPMIQAGFRYIAQNVSPGGRPTEMYTYNVITQMLAIETGYREMLRKKAPGNAVEKALLAIFEANFDYCQKALKNGEAGYTIDQQGLDLSNTQFVVMGLEAADRAGYRLPREVWLSILKKTLKLQAEDGPPVESVNITSNKGDEVDKDGYIIRDRYRWITGKAAKARGWTYGEFFKKDEIYGSMTCAGVANLLSCYLVLEKDPAFKREWEKEFQVAVRDGLAWLQKYYAVNANPAEPSFWSMGRLYKGDTFWTYYYLFTLARITRATNIRFIGNRNWFVEGCNFLLRAQRSEGNWDQVAHETHNFKSDCIPLVNTSMALWFFSSLDHTRTTDPEAEAEAARKAGKAPAKMGDFVFTMTKMLKDIYRDRERWDVDSPYDGTADVLLGWGSHPSYKDARDGKQVKSASAYVLGSTIPSVKAMDVALKKLRAPDTMSEYYGKHLLYERWQTATLSRVVLAAVAHAMSAKDWDRLAKAEPGGRTRVASGAKKVVAAVVRHMASQAKKVGRDKLGWTASCGRPTVLKPDAESTAQAVRALHGAALCGVSQSSALWKAAARFLLTAQEERGPQVELLDGEGKATGAKGRARGFGKLPGDPAELELTFDVLSALILAKTYGKAKGKFKEELDAAVRDGLAWLQLHFKGYYDFALLVSAKRLGMLTGRRMLGTLDWKAEGLKFIGFQNESRGYLVPDAARRVAFTLYFVSPRFLA